MPRLGPASELFIERHLVPELRAWRGEMSLAAVFWIYGVFVSAELAMLHVIALYLDQIWVQQAVILAFALYTPGILVAIWRCGTTYRAIRPRSGSASTPYSRRCPTASI